MSIWNNNVTVFTVHRFIKSPRVVEQRVEMIHSVLNSLQGTLYISSPTVKLSSSRILNLCSIVTKYTRIIPYQYKYQDIALSCIPP